MRVARLVARLLDSALSRAENEDCCLGVAEEEEEEGGEEEEEELGAEDEGGPMTNELLAVPAACSRGDSFSGDASSPKASTTVISLSIPPIVSKLPNFRKVKLKTLTVFDRGGFLRNRVSRDEIAVSREAGLRNRPHRPAPHAPKWYPYSAAAARRQELVFFCLLSRFFPFAVSSVLESDGIGF